MSASGLIYAAIAIMWAAVLIPMWLRNHESATEKRSAERFGQAMRVLSRKESGDPADRFDHEVEHGVDHGIDHAGDQRGDWEPAHPVEPEIPAAPQRTQPSAARPARRRVTLAQRRARRQATRSRPAESTSRSRAPLTITQRRARTLGALAGLSLVMIVLSILTPVPWWSALPFLLLLTAFVVHLRVQARQRLGRRRSTSTGTTARASRPERAVGSRRTAGRTAAAESADEVGQAPTSSDESGVVQGPSRAVVVERKGESAASDQTPDAADPDAWRPNPLPLPTYVTAPKAVRPIKVIDLTTPGAWSSGRLLEDDVADEDLLAAQVAEEELDALIGEQVAAAVETPNDDDRRAVGD